MLLFCRNCGKELAVNPDKTCAACGGKPVRAAAEDITANCTYQSNSELIATVNASGIVKAVDPGAAIIMVFYTVVPGTANFTGASTGKVPVTFSVNVSVTVE